jgi:hypothetical protein
VELGEFDWRGYQWNLGNLVAVYPRFNHKGVSMDGAEVGG